MKRKNPYYVGMKNTCMRKISKKLDKQIALKMKQLQDKSKNPEKITYLGVTKILEVRLKNEK